MFLFKIMIGECRIRKAVSEWISDVHIRFVPVFVSGIYAFKITACFPFFLAQEPRDLLVVFYERFGQAALGIALAEQDIDKRFLPVAAAKIRIHDAAHLFLPWHGDRRAAFHHHNDPGMNLRNRFDHGIDPLRQIKGRPVKSFRFVFIGQGGTDHDRFAFFS